MAVLEDLPSFRPPLDHLVELLPRLQARYYSISSSPKVGSPSYSSLLSLLLLSSVYLLFSPCLSLSLLRVQQYTYIRKMHIDRYFSLKLIQMNPTSVHVTAVLIDYTTRTGRRNMGVATGWLKRHQQKVQNGEPLGRAGKESSHTPSNVNTNGSEESVHVSEAFRG